MKIIRNSLIGVVAILVIVIGFWQYHRHMIVAYAKTVLAQSYRISPAQVTIERAQELGFWRNKLNPFTPQTWSILFTIPGGPTPSNGSYGCTIDETNFGHFGPPIIPGPDAMKPAVTIPTLSQIKTAKVSLNIPNLRGTTNIIPTAPHDKAVLQKVLGWLKTAEPVSYEDPHQPMPSEGPTTLVLQLTNGQEILVQPARNCTATGNSTVCNDAQGYIDFQYADSTQKLRLHSPELDTWLLRTWKSDIQSYQG